MSGPDREPEALKSGSESSWRRTTATVLLFALFFAAAVANVSVWLQTTISNTDDFVATFEPLPDDVPVAELLGQSIADATVDPEALAASLSDKLPDGLQALAVPIATSVNDLAANAATRIVESDAFEAIWGRALRAAHTTLLDLLALRSKTQALIVDVTEAAEQLADRLEGLGIEVTVPEAPTITIIQTSQNPVLFSTLRFVYTTGWVFPVLFVLLLAGVVALRRNRRSAVVSVGLVTAGAMLFDLVLMRILRTTLSDQAADNLVRSALRSAWDTVTTRLHWQTWIVLLVALLAAGVARYAVTGAGASFPSPAMSDYLDRWGTLTQVVVIVLALLMMLLIPSISFGLAALIAVIAAVLVFLVSAGKQGAGDSVKT